MSKHRLPNISATPTLSFQELMAATRTLTQILDEESGYLDRFEVARLPSLQEEKQRLTKQLETYQAVLLVDPSLVQNAPANQREELLQMTDDLAFAVEENFRRASVARAVNQRVMQAVMDVMSDSQRPATYDRMGQAGMPAHMTLSMSLNERA